ncbi:MAG: hypothetical protein WCF17_16005 [Terracidiphilus sp.]
MEVDNIKRFRGLSPDAGRAAAIRRLSSKKENLRRKGMAVLTDIGETIHRHIDIALEP